MAMLAISHDVIFLDGAGCDTYNVGMPCQKPIEMTSLNLPRDNVLINPFLELRGTFLVILHVFNEAVRTGDFRLCDSGSFLFHFSASLLLWV